MLSCVDLTGVHSLLGLVQEYCRGFSHKGYQLMYHRQVVCSKNGRFSNQETEVSVADGLSHQAPATRGTVDDNQISFLFSHECLDDGNCRTFPNIHLTREKG